ncbi:MAG: diguanylate cyclase [Bacteroidetes bacterium]|jgi:dihydroorotate dehydrogenase (fumarate)|nr:diguanylate cyclase [Bacteroidota bacterium]
MPDLSTKYLGLTLRNPIVVGSSGLTDSVEKIVELDKNGVGAVVLKSLFEEQIMLEADHSLKKAQEDGMIYSEYSETLDYIDVHVKEKELGNYIQLISEAKNKVSIPIIASINAISDMEWTSFAKQIEDAGADALELNIFVMPFNMDNDCDTNEKMYYNIVRKVKSIISIPVAVKLSPYFANLGKVIARIEETGANGVVLFNRFSNPDIDIDNERTTVADIYSLPTDIATSLRWIAIMAKHVKFDLAASTGIHDGAAVIKQLLAGAKVTQVTSAIYKKGPEIIVEMLSFVHDWMEQKGYNYVDQFRGKLSQAETSDINVYERIQFMKYFSDYK